MAYTNLDTDLTRRSRSGRAQGVSFADQPQLIPSPQVRLTRARCRRSEPSRQ